MAIAATLVLAIAAPLAHAASPTAFVYASDSAPRLPQYSADENGLLTPLTPPLAQGVATSAGVAASPDGRTLYVVDQLSNDVSQYAIADDGTLSPRTPATVATGTGPFGIAVSADGRHVYVANQTAGTISVFTAGSDGALDPGAAVVSSGASTVQVALSPDGGSLYATNASAGTISQYDVDPTDGSLTPKATPTVPAGSVPYAIAVSPDGQSVYVTNRVSSGSVRRYAVGAGGALDPTPTIAAAATRPAGVLATDDAVYVTNFASDTIARYDTDAALTREADVPGPHSPFGMSLSPDGHSLYVAGFGSGTVGQYDVGADGALTAKDPMTVLADVQPIDVVAVRAPDKEPPTVELTTPADGAQYTQGSDVDADYACADTGTSGLQSCTGDVADGAAIDTSTLGTFDFTVTARDGDGNETTVTHSYTVIAPPRTSFGGFVGPTHDGSVVTAGSVVPIAFTLGGDRGLDVLAVGSPTSVRVDCSSPGLPTGGYPAQSADGLRFDAASGAYTFAWQTRSSWAGTCRAFVVTLSDGSVARLVVSFCQPSRYYHSRRYW
jgi:YVTN family beta-propeller protein